MEAFESWEVPAPALPQKKWQLITMPLLTAILVGTVIIVILAILHNGRF